MFGKKSPQVLVVGAGPVGMLGALALARRGVRVEVIDEQWRPAARSYGLALHPRTLELLDRVGLGAAVTERGHRVSHLALYDASERRAEVSFSDLPGAHPYLLILPQRQLEELLEAELRREKVTVQWNHRLASLEQDGDGVRAKVERLGKDSTGYSYATTVWVVDAEHVVSPELVLGADGHRSVVRRSLGIDFLEQGPAELYAVFEHEASGPSESEAVVVLDNRSANVLWPLGEGRFRWSFQLFDWPTPGPRWKSRLFVQVGQGSYPHLDREIFEELLQVRAPWYTQRIGDVVWSAAVRFEKRLASDWGRGRAWLAGDAAHLAGPVGVQSMNGGLAEVCDLAERMSQVLAGSRRDRLEDHGRIQHQKWRERLDPGSGAWRAACEDGWVAEQLDRIPECVPSLGTDLELLLGQLGIEPKGSSG